MAYYSGTAASLTALRTALLTHAQADGWVLTGDVLSKVGVYFQIQVNATNITCLGCESNVVANPAPGVVMMGRIFSGQPIREITFPGSYEVFGFAQELYLIVNYDVDSYQWMAFGKSTVPGLPGQGGWCGSMTGPVAAVFGAAPIDFLLTSVTSYDQTSSAQLISGRLFVTHRQDTYNASSWQASWVNSGLDTHGWKYGLNNNSPSIGLGPAVSLLWQQPSVWNNEATLLPIRAWKERPSYKVSMTVDLANARMIRIDNLTPGDILTLGSDKWKVFPWYRKDTTSRNGGYAVNHTGTFGWAIRYEGP